MNLDEFQTSAKKLEESARFFTHSDFEFHLKLLQKAQEMLLTTYAPFKNGDRVELAKTPEISTTKSWGLMGSKHVLTEGATGTVVHLEVRMSGLFVAVLLDYDTWIDYKGVEKERVDKHPYAFEVEYWRHSKPKVGENQKLF